MTLVSSQGSNLLSGFTCTNVKISVQSSEGGGGGGGTDKVEVSHLGIAHGGLKEFAPAPLRDPNAPEADEDGNTTTITVSFYGATPPVVGNTYTVAGISAKCTQSEIEYAVGEYVKGSATFVSVAAS